ncbi:hypothetical protein ACFPPD_11580 [Cohnella suwonensis]|uniref:Lipoprotein n=1 Tax=Cohnella suwonensis TaxID=696072 RepID=A0ABW0LU31_9BACL
MKKITIACALLAVLLAGCGERNASQEQIAGNSPSASAAPEEELAPMPDGGLDPVMEKLKERANELAKKQDMAILWYGAGAGEMIEMNVRSYGDIEHKLTDKELDAFMISLFEWNGEPFPIKMTVSECCGDELGPLGVVTEIDMERNRILVVSATEKNGNTEDPAAVWIGLTDDAKVYVDGKPAPREFDESLIGKEARAWTTGIVEQSYPSQVTGIKVMIG